MPKEENCNCMIAYLKCRANFGAILKKQKNEEITMISTCVKEYRECFMKCEKVTHQTEPEYTYF